MSTWYENAAFYHMYPLGMTGAPKQNPADEPNGAAAPHRFSDLIRWIPHMKRLHFTAVYIGPLFESSTHGYDTRDFRLVDRRLGTNEDFKQFVSLCHESGIRVVVDGVFNHTGRDFFAFRDIREKGGSSPYCGWYKGINFGWGSPLGDAFGYESWHGIWELPCLNLPNPEVRNYLLDTVRFWVDEFDIDGIRLDCANVLDFQFMKELRRLANEIKPDFWLMGEVIHGEYGRWVNDETLHSVTNYEMHKSIYSAHNDHNYFELAHNVRRLEAVGRSLYTFVDNHDEDRIASKLHNPAHLAPVYTLLYTLPGIPSVYYGSEWGIPGQRSRTSDEVLRPAISADEAAAKDAKHLPLTALIEKLGEIHREEDALHGGLYKELLLTNRQYAFARFGRTKDDTGKDGSRPEGTDREYALVTAANNDDQPVSIRVPLPIHTQSTTCTDRLTGTVFPIENNQIHADLEGNSAVILKITEGEML